VRRRVTMTEGERSWALGERARKDGLRLENNKSDRLEGRWTQKITRRAVAATVQQRFRSVMTPSKTWDTVQGTYSPSSANFERES